MTAEKQIEAFIAGQPEPKRSDMQELHQRILQLAPGCKLWFMDGKNEENKTVSNPNIGYGTQVMKYANGKTAEWFKVSISPNTTGISVYMLGLKDKKHLAEAYGKTIGKASVTGYCIKFKTLKDIRMDVLEEAIRYGLEQEG